MIWYLVVEWIGVDNHSSSNNMGNSEGCYELQPSKVLILLFLLQQQRVRVRATGSRVGVHDETK